MSNGNDLLIVIDAGHGGSDPGAVWEGRLEKDDTLRLALETQKQLLAQNIPVLMTRDTDVYVSLEDRAEMANRAGADLFVSLHRNSHIEQTPTANGVENYIYLTAPEATTGRAAQYVLNRVVDVGVQSNRGVKRGNYYVLRRTIMPAMLLEMGFINNYIDNQLFDEHLVDYAAAIARGIMDYFGLIFQEKPDITPPLPPEFPPCPVCPNAGVMEAQLLLNNRFGLTMPLSGFFDDTSARAATMALQIALNSDFNAGLIVDGVFGAKTQAALPTVRLGSRGNLTFVVQTLLQLNGFSPGIIDGVFGAETMSATQMFQRDNYLVPDGIIGKETFTRLLGA